MRALSFIFAAAVLASAPMALAQTDAPPAATEATTPEGYTAIEPADPAELTAPMEEPAATAEEPAVEAGAVEPELICRSVRTRTESRLRARERVCRTQAQWDEAEAEATRNNSSRAGPNNN